MPGMSFPIVKGRYVVSAEPVAVAVAHLAVGGVQIRSVAEILPRAARQLYCRLAAGGSLLRLVGALRITRTCG